MLKGDATLIQAVETDRCKIDQDLKVTVKTCGNSAFQWKGTGDTDSAVLQETCEYSNYNNQIQNHMYK